MHVLRRILDGLERAMQRVAAACLLGMALLTGSDVVGRAAFNHPIFGTEELVAMLAVLVIGLSLPYTHSQGSHIGVELVVSRLPRRLRRGLRRATDGLSMALFAVVAWRMAVYGWTRQQSGVVSMNLELPDYLVVYALAVCFAVFALRIGLDVLADMLPEGHAGAPRDQRPRAAGGEG